MKTKDEIIGSLKKALEELDITSSLRLPIIQTIEYLQEEHEYLEEETKYCAFSTSSYTDKERKALCKGCEEECRFNKKEEPTIPDIVDEHFDEMLGEDPVSEDLEKEMESFFIKMQVQENENIFEDTFKNIARYFAAWQKEQDKQWLAENHKHIFAKGRESAEVWISADDDVNNAAEKTTRRFCKISLLSGDYLSLAEAQPQVNKESKLIAIKSFVCGAQWDRNKLMKEAVEEEVIEIIDYNSSSHHEYSRLMIEVDKEKFKEGDKVRVLIIKEK